MKIRLNNVRLAFLKCWKAETVNGEGEPAFSTSMILTPNHPQMKELEAAILETAKVKWGAKTDMMMKKMKAGDKLALHDGDTKAQYDGFEGNMFVAARTKVRPLTLAGGPQGKTPTTESEGKLYSGCYANVSLELWAQDNAYGQRVNAELKGIQFVKDGDAFGGGGTAADESDFDELEEGADASDLV